MPTNKLIRVVLKIFSALPFLLIPFLFSCDGGLQPEDASQQPGFSGTVTFVGNWPPNVNRTHIVLFKEPLLSSADFNAVNLKYVSEEIPNDVSEYNYSTLVNSLLESIESGEYAYLAVAQSSTIFLSLNRSSWTVVGVYSNEDGSNTLTIPTGKFVSGINITCDFNNPPQQPPGGF